MLSPLFGVEALVREPSGFGDQETPREPDRSVRGGHQDGAGRRPGNGVPPQDQLSRATSVDSPARA
jgi:hypothetical protein